MSRPAPETHAGLAALALALFAGPLVAADADRELPAHIEADRVEIDNQREISVYEGKVTFSQGSTRVSGDRVTLRTRAGEVRHLLIEGEPARFSETSNGGQPVEAQGLEIEYDADASQVRIEGRAMLSRPGESFSGETIRYRTDTEVVTARKADDGSGERVRIVIQPAEDKP